MKRDEDDLLKDLVAELPPHLADVYESVRDLVAAHLRDIADRRTHHFVTRLFWTALIVDIAQSNDKERPTLTDEDMTLLEDIAMELEEGGVREWLAGLCTMLRMDKIVRFTERWPELPAENDENAMTVFLADIYQEVVPYVGGVRIDELVKCLPIRRDD